MHLGNRGHDGRATAQCAEHPLGGKAHRQFDRTADARRGHKHRGEAEDMCHRQRAIDEIVRCQGAQVARGFGCEDQIAMRQHDPLGRSGRAGGVKDHRHPVRALLRGLDRARHQRRTPQRPESRDAGLRPRGVCMGCSLGRDMRRVERDFRPCMFGHAVDLGGCQPGVHRHRPCPNAAAREDEHRDAQAVLGHDQHPVARPHTLRRHQCRGLFDMLGIGAPVDGASIRVDHGDGVGACRDMRIEHLVNSCQPRHAAPLSAFPGVMRRSDG